MKHNVVIIPYGGGTNGFFYKIYLLKITNFLIYSHIGFTSKR